MAGPGAGKRRIKVTAYIHQAGKSRARITHIDIEGPDIAKIIKPGESTYCAGKPGGVFIGLKKAMLVRAEKMVKK